jgi:hypothetical protein
MAAGVSLRNCDLARTLAEPILEVVGIDASTAYLSPPTAGDRCNKVTAHVSRLTVLF